MKLRKLQRPWLKYTLIGLMLSTGCRGPVNRFAAWRDTKDIAYYQKFAHQIEYPDVASVNAFETVDLAAPLTLKNPSEVPAWELTLQEAVASALRSSDVLRSIGGTIVQAPTTTGTVLDPGLVESNPLNGVEAALSQFDAQVSTRLFWQKNDRPVNRAATPPFDQIFAGALAQTTGNYINSVSKTTAQGAQFSLNSNVLYDRNNNLGLAFPSSFVGFLEAQYRQPLMQGAGTTYNRIAGPNSVVGQYNGVLIARINMDVSLADFERSVLTLVNDIETAYWELYFAYRDLDAKVVGRENSLKTWQRIHELQKVGARGGEADAEAQARSQYYLFDSQVNDALAGPRGLYQAEQQLRYLMGVAATDGRLIKPTDLPLQAELQFDWYEALGDATQQRVEIRRQKWQIKKRELEMLASRLNRRARLDAVTSYRQRGLADHLFDNNNGLLQEIAQGNYQEWQAGLEWNYNVGLRQASAAMRNAQLNLVRENSVLKEMELKISHDLSNAQRQIARSYAQVQTNYNRVEADRQQVDVLRNRYERGLININFLLQAQQSLANSTSGYHRALSDYMLAIRDFHREKGSLLNYNQVQLAEAGYSGDAYRSAYERGRDYTPRDPGATVTTQPGLVTQGPFDPTSIGEVVTPMIQNP
jgi:outer membrane protein TolC